MSAISEEHKAKGKEIWELIKAQPPEVLVWLSDFCGMDDGEPMMREHPDDAIQDMLESAGYPEDGKDLLGQTICLGMSLPDITVDIRFKPDPDSDDPYTWEFSKP